MSGIVRKSFSITLALRYLNPLRTHVSAITLIALLGVAVGVMVLIVVLAVMGGFEREIKSRILGFTPHVVLRYAPRDFTEGPVPWRELCVEMEKVEGVEEAYAFIQDNVIVDYSGLQANSSFRAIDTENPKQIGALWELLLESGGGEADMGMDEKAVVAETTANMFGLRVGDMIQLYSTRNFDQVMSAYKLTDSDPVHLSHAEALVAVREELKQQMTMEGGKESFEFETLKGIYETLLFIHNGNIRPGEEALLLEALELLNSGEKGASETKRLLPPGTVDEILARLDGFAQLDMEKEDGKVLKGIKEIVLPKDVEVIGIYKASQQVLHPGLFVPLPTGQELRGVQDGVDGVALRVTDPYRAALVAERVKVAAGEDWAVSVWMDQHEDWFDLMKTEKLMMYLTLSFIILMAAFCIGAVMFTVTIQKKQEIGVMKALGAVPGQVVNVFLYQGMIVGVAGGLLGVGLGLLVVRFRTQVLDGIRMLGIDPFPARFHLMSKIPAHVNPVEVVFIAAGAFVLCSLATLLPAFMAARSDPAKSLRNL